VVAQVYKVSKPQRSTTKRNRRLGLSPSAGVITGAINTQRALCNTRWQQQRQEVKNFQSRRL